MKYRVVITNNETLEEHQYNAADIPTAYSLVEQEMGAFTSTKTKRGILCIGFPLPHDEARYAHSLSNFTALIKENFNEVRL